MLKNWVVVTKQIKKQEKGLLNHVNYLTDKSKASHHYTDISVLTDNACNIIRAVDSLKKSRRKRGLRGGGISNYSTSFVLTVPRDIQQPSISDWEKILEIAYKVIAKETGFDKGTIEKHAYAVLHDESSSPAKETHVHLLVSNVINNQYQKRVTQLAVTFDLSPKFNTMTLMRFPINWRQWRSQNEKALQRRTNHKSYQAA